MIIKHKFVGTIFDRSYFDEYKRVDTNGNELLCHICGWCGEERVLLINGQLIRGNNHYCRNNMILFRFEWGQFVFVPKTGDVNE